MPVFSPFWQFSPDSSQVIGVYAAKYGKLDEKAI